jgi:hypothetical protein
VWNFTPVAATRPWIARFSPWSVKGRIPVRRDEDFGARPPLPPALPEVDAKDPGEGGVHRHDAVLAPLPLSHQDRQSL